MSVSDHHTAPTVLPLFRMMSEALSPQFKETVIPKMFAAERLFRDYCIAMLDANERPAQCTIPNPDSSQDVLTKLTAACLDKVSNFLQQEIKSYRQVHLGESAPVVSFYAELSQYRAQVVADCFKSFLNVVENQKYAPDLAPNTTLSAAVEPIHDMAVSEPIAPHYDLCENDDNNSHLSLTLQAQRYQVLGPEEQQEDGGSGEGKAALNRSINSTLDMSKVIDASTNPFSEDFNDPTSAATPPQQHQSGRTTPTRPTQTHDS